MEYLGCSQGYFRLSRVVICYFLCSGTGKMGIIEVNIFRKGDTLKIRTQMGIYGDETGAEERLRLDDGKRGNR